MMTSSEDPFLVLPRAPQPKPTTVPRGIFAYPKGIFKASRRWEKYICILSISKYLYIYHWVLLSKIIICLLLNMSMN